MFKATTLFLLLSVMNCTASETLLRGQDISAALTDVILYSENNGQPVEQIFQKSGVTYYNIGGAQSQGFWNVTGDQYCSIWPPNLTRSCFDIARDQDRIIFIAKSGKRFDFRLTK